MVQAMAQMQDNNGKFDLTKVILPGRTVKSMRHAMAAMKAEGLKFLSDSSAADATDSKYFQ